MQVHQFPNIPSSIGALAATTGFFDGVHCGHAAVLHRLTQAASEIGLPSCVITYDPHPRVVLGRDSGLKLLCSSEEKRRLLASHGVDHLIAIPFTKSLANMQPDDFFEQYLVNALHVRALVVGFDHNMGKNALGDFAKIKSLGEKHHVPVHQVAPYVQEVAAVSSTKIRSALQDGNIAAANKMLGYPYALSGTVCSGMRIGRTIGYPTANIRLACAQKMLPRDGAYAVRILRGSAQHSGMLNIGTRNTLSHPTALSIEAHIFDFSQDIYGGSLTVHFVAKLRDVQKIGSVSELKKQLEADEANARKILAM